MIRLGESSARLLDTGPGTYLSELVDSLGESANLAMLDGDQIVYVGQVQSRQSMRMFTEVGRRVSPHCTAVGKALLALIDPADVQALLSRTGMHAHTEHTITDPQAFAAQLEQVLERGYATDDGEHELGVRCVAVAVPRALTDRPLRLGAGHSHDRRPGGPGRPAPDRRRPTALGRPCFRPAPVQVGPGIWASLKH